MNSPPRQGSTPPSRSVAAGRARGPNHPAGHPAVRPFLKWAGGKRQLLPALRQFYPEEFETYHEPFLGSGAVFFDLANGNRLRNGAVRLSDVNADLVGCWLQLRDHPEALVGHLRTLAADHDAASHDHYYQVRDAFNPLRKEIWNGSGPRAEEYAANLAAMFIYLNRTGYNGLFRQNSSGLFNVPRGSYKNPKICDESNLHLVSSALSALSAKIEHASFDAVLDAAQRGDFIYFDPPYAPLSSTAHFTSYTPDGFGADHQRELQQVVFELARNGCHVVLSNSTAAEIAALYDGNKDAKRAGIQAHRVPARRAINSNASRRGHVDEYIITNVSRRTA